MNRRELISRIANVMRKEDLKKTISMPKQIFHISDDEGNQKDFIVKKSDKRVLYTADDIDAVIGACMTAVEEALMNGESISIKGFGTLGLKYRAQRATKRPGTDEWVDVEARYIPKFSFGDRLRRCGKVYELSLNDRLNGGAVTYFDSDTEDGD